MTTIARAFNDLDALHANLLDAESRIVDLTDTNQHLLGENARLRNELDAARGQAADANARATWKDMAP